MFQPLYDDNQSHYSQRCLDYLGLDNNSIMKAVIPAMESNIEREATAYHEAGHAVAGFDLKRAFTKVSIVPDDTSLGHCAFVPRPLKLDPDYRTVDSKFRNIMERRAMTSLPGGEAEKLFYRISNWKYNSSHRRMIQV
jgi:hypothetical protein